MVCIGPYLHGPALYAKATETAWKHTSKYANIILRMGTFHIIITLLAIIGKWFQDAGLRDTCIESGIIAEGSVFGVLAGRMYSRAVRVHKIMRLYFISPGKVSLSSPPKPDALSQCIA